ncbi:biotin transporter BioY [Tepidibacter formicigenes]|jgi:biotin transport system substrate-specific component|uniref:Biotin transporter n=1 Tax=Tepidibacter formicigenes DSM 15518 TaxID=1123349 RepID=A0A1M6JPY6_9FIRM|nr:biotin transporter BioY [Tepidibacter formicigenes]SHJ48771.1 biotin transport system substrate-specific component [Tepidibacter formicigenes DSM 15518]
MKIKTRDMILISIFAALTAIGAFIKIPTPIVPFTLQFLFCAYSGIFLGGKYGMYSQLLYVGIGLIGIPVFANGGGITYIFQPTFGYLIGFIVCSYVVGKLTENLDKVSFTKIFAPVLIGLFFVYLFGVSYLYMIINLYMKKEMSIRSAIAAGFTPYITSDLILSVLVSVTSLYVIPAIRKAGFKKELVK